MCYFVGIESLATGALIELLRKDTRSVSFQALEQYGTAVVRVLNGMDDSERALLVLSRERTRSFIRDCSDLFDAEAVDSPNGRLTLKGGVQVEDVVSRLCGGIPVPVFKALLDEASVKALLAA